MTPADRGTRNLVDAAKAVGVRRMIAQSLAIVYAPGAKPATEEDPLADKLPALRDTVKGMRSLEAAVEELPEGVILRYGLLYGPGTWYSEAVPSPMRCNTVSDPPVTGSVHSSMWKMPRGRRCSRSIGQRGWSISSTTNRLPEPNGCRDSLAAIGAPPPPLGEHGGEQGASNRRARQHLGGNRCTRPGVKGSGRRSIEFSN